MRWRRSGPPPVDGRSGRIWWSLVPVAAAALGVAAVFDRSAGFAAALLVVPIGVVATWHRCAAIERRVAGYVLASAVELVVVARLMSGLAGATFRDAILRGWSRTVSTPWPSPPRAELVVFAAFLVVASSIATAELARSGRWRSLVVVPSLALLIALVSLSAPAGSLPVWVLATWLVGAVGVLLVGDARPTLRSRVRRATGEPWAFAGTALTVVLGLLVFAGLDLGRRADPRNERSGRIDLVDTFNPLSAVAAERVTEPPVDLFEVTGEMPERLRTFAAEQYDGVGWSVLPVFGPVGQRFSPTFPGEESTLRFEVLARRLDWLPIHGTLLEVDRVVVADPERSMFRLDPAVQPGDDVSVIVGAPIVGEALDAEPVLAPPDEFGERFRARALELAGDAQTLDEQLTAIAEAFREDFELEPDAPITTSARAMDLILANSRDASEEQFAAAYVLLARSLGARARVAVGYVPPSDARVVTTADARAWPEVLTSTAGWVSIDAVPRNTSQAPPEPVTEVDGRAATPPPPLPPPAPSPEEEAPGATSTASGTTWLDRILVAAAVVFGGVTIIVLTIGTLLGGVVFAKVRRRRRRLRSVRPADQVIGVWAEATDTLVDHGAVFGAHQSNVDIALAGTSIAGDDAEGSLLTLARLANLAAHSPADPDAMAVTQSVRLLGQVEEAIALRHTRIQRLVALVTARSLRRRTRSPVR